MEWIKNRFNKNVNSPNFNANKSRFRNVIASIVDLAAQLIKGFGKVFFKIIGFGYGSTQDWSAFSNSKAE